MGKKDKDRIQFFSKEDLSGATQLKEAEGILNNIQLGVNLGLNDLFKFYNIKLYFDNRIFLTNWTEQQKYKYINIVEQSFKILKERIFYLKDNSIEQELKCLDYIYFKDFWKLFDNLNIYKNILEQTIYRILKNNQTHIYHILEQKRIVEKFDKVIRDFLMDYENSAEIFLLSLEENDDFRKKETKFFPKKLSQIDKEFIVNAYLDSNEPNLNYVRLIEKSRDTSDFKLSARTRLKAKRRSEELNQRILDKGNTWNTGISVTFDKDQVEPLIIKNDNKFFEASYSEKFIDKFTYDESLFQMFKYLFFFTDDKNLITLVSRQNELNVFEQISMKSKHEYVIGLAFNRKNNCSLVQLIIYEDYFKRKKFLH